MAQKDKANIDPAKAHDQLAKVCSKAKAQAKGSNAKSRKLSGMSSAPGKQSDIKTRPPAVHAKK